MNKLQSTSHGESQVRRFSGDIGEDDMRRWSCSPLTYEDAIRHSQADSPISASESCYDEVFRNPTSSGYYSASSENRSRATTSSNMMSETLVQDLQSNDAVFEESGGIIPSPIKFNFDEAELRRRGIRTHRSNDNIRLPEMDIKEAQAIYNQYRKKTRRWHMFSSKGNAEDIKTTFVYRYRINSWMEIRTRETRTKPFSGGCEVDGPQNAYSPPNLWEITCRGMDGERVKVPHTSKVASCANCNGYGHTTCRTCSGSRHTSCYHCNGNGRISKTEESVEMWFQPPAITKRATSETCHKCSGSGHERCTYCNQHGRNTCQKCNGKGKLFCYDEMVVKMRKLSDHYLSGPEVPEKKIWKCDVHKIFSATGKSVLPLTPNECVDDSILNASATFVDLHKGFANYHGKLQKQEHCIELIPVYKAKISSGRKTEYLWILGRNKLTWLQKA